ncbi:MAG: hypothetical protein CR972_01180 [Candidatus Moraniibacteriota bacterium]|nr:MAG: hypothetical protein CR972_01180 [Candidatus Moranbacteria bacterium]
MNTIFWKFVRRREYARYSTFLVLGVFSICISLRFLSITCARFRERELLYTIGDLILFPIILLSGICLVHLSTMVYACAGYDMIFAHVVLVCMIFGGVADIFRGKNHYFIHFHGTKNNKRVFFLLLFLVLCVL